MGVITMTIDGTDVLAYLQKGLQHANVLNGRPTLRCKLVVRDGDSYRPDVRDEVLVEDGGTPVFGGFVWTITETDVVDYKHRLLDVECVGFEAFADAVLINGIVTSDNLENMLVDTVANLSPHGISVDATMSSGATLDDQGFPFFTIRQAIEQLALVSGWNMKWDFQKKVRMDAGGSVGAPFALTDTNSSILSLSHTKTLAGYNNEIWNIFGDSSQQAVTDEFTGDGTTTTFELHYPIATAPAVVIEGPDTFPVGGTGGWTYSATPTPRVIKSSAPANGVVISVPFTAQFPGATFYRDATEYSTYGPWTDKIYYPDIFDWEKANVIAQSEVTRRKGVVRKLKARTATAGLEPGMTVNVTATKRGLSSVNFLITAVSIQHQTKKANGEHLFFYDIDAIEGNQYQANWTQYFRNLGRGGSAGTAGGVSGGGGSTTTTTVRGAFWGGSRLNGIDVDGWQDVPNYLPVRLDGTNGSPVTVRVEQRTVNSGTSVQVRIVKVSDTTVMATGATSTSTSWDEELLTFTPSSGSTDYKLQAQRGNSNARVFAIGQSL